MLVLNAKDQGSIVRCDININFSAKKLAETDILFKKY